MLLACNFKELPGRPLLNLQYCAGLCTTSLRKTHAPIFGQDYLQLWICESRFHRVVGEALGFGWRKQWSDVHQESGVSRLGEHALASSLAKFAAVVATWWRG